MTIKLTAIYMMYKIMKLNI